MMNLGVPAIRRFAGLVFLKSNGDACELGNGFDPKCYYNDLRYLICRVNQLIQMGKRIDDHQVIGPIRNRYQCSDVLSCLRHLVKVDDQELWDLRNRFVENMSRYSLSLSMPRINMLKPSNPRVEWREDAQRKKEYQMLSEELTVRMTKKIGHIMVA